MRDSVIHGEPQSWDAEPSKRYLVWRDGPSGYRIYDAEHPILTDGDPGVLGEPIYPVGKTLSELALLLKE